MLHSMQKGSSRERRAHTSASSPLYAALDLGTNNCRLLIASQGAEANGQSLRVQDSFSRIVRLGEGVAEHGALSDAAMDRTLQALEACQKKLDKCHIESARFVATEACRKASNASAFMQHVNKQLGLDIEIISSEEEAKLAFLGCASLLKPETKRAIVFDIGGGSTEMMWIDVSTDEHKILDWVSVPSGVMNLADKFGGPSMADLAFNDMTAYVGEQFAAFCEKNHIADYHGDSSVQLLSTSGTVTTLAAVKMELPKYDRTRIDGITLPVDDIRDATKSLLKMRPSQRFNHPCIGSDRSDYIMSGCAIFEAISTLWPSGTITIADRGVREGIILSLMQPHG